MLYNTSETVKYSLVNNFSATYKVNLHRIRINLFYYLNYKVNLHRIRINLFYYLKYHVREI